MSTQIYDPRYGQDYEWRDHQTKKLHSSIDYNLFVLESTELQWSEKSELIAEAVDCTSTQAFITVAPFIHVREKLLDVLPSTYKDTHRFEDSIIAYLPNTVAGFRSCLQLWSDSGGHQSGNWCFGGCFGMLAEPIRHSLARADSWNGAYILSQLDRVGTLFELGEMHQTFIFTRLFPTLDEWLNRVLQQTGDQKV